MYFRGTTEGNDAAACIAKQVNYDPSRDSDGSLTFGVEAQSNAFGLEWGRMITPGIRTDTGIANGTSVDQGTGSTSFGLQAYIQTFDFTGTDVTVAFHESQNDGSPDAWGAVTGGAFTTITSGDQHQERIATATGQTIERWLRLTTSTSGGFSALEFAVMFVRNTAVPVF